ncbi:hypothetical protein Bca52824_003380 [Brassica carinata]|uniref:Uncharacterized protein n=1 Tax=Brassica carinata TaxID=52824 RepID=A0A8X8BEQ3_BRACI|nr:hypothetical protein Bca52824_003380 [Brassica carinata]
MGGGSRCWFKLGVAFLGRQLMASVLGSISKLIPAVYMPSLSFRLGLRSGSFNFPGVCFHLALSTGGGSALRVSLYSWKIAPKLENMAGGVFSSCSKMLLCCWRRGTNGTFICYFLHLADPNDKSNEAANIVTPTKVVEDAGPSGTAEEDHRSMLHVDGDDANPICVEIAGFCSSDKSRKTRSMSDPWTWMRYRPLAPAQSDPVGEETVIVPEVPAEDVTSPAQSDAQMGDEPTTVSEVQPEATMNQSPTPETVMPSENREKNHGGELPTPELPLRTTVDPISQSTEEGQQSSPAKPDGFIRYSKRQRNSPERFNPDDPKWKLDGAKAPIWVDF